jgi:hypothetical protein
MQVLGVGGRLAEAGVVVGDEGGKERVAVGDSVDPGEAQLLLTKRLVNRSAAQYCK